MFVSRISRAKQHIHQPMIKFLGSRKNLEHEPHAPSPHPAAPQEVVDDFQSFLAKLQSTSKGSQWPSSTPKGQSPSQSAQGKTPDETGAGGSGSPSTSSSGGAAKSSGKPADFENFWEAPRYYWQPREVSEREMEAVMSGGATDIRSGP